MAEKIVEVHTVRVYKIHDENGCNGVMRVPYSPVIMATGHIEHRCDVCNIQAFYEKDYPALEFKELPL